MSKRKMLSRRQCIFVIVVMPLLIVPAILILKHADSSSTLEVFVLPKKDSIPPHASVRTQKKHSLTKAVKPAIKRKVIRKCNEYIWTGTCSNTCYMYNTLAKQRQRKQQVFKCDNSKTQLKTLFTSKQKYVHKVPFRDPCLRKVADWYCRDGRVVPNIVHYVWFGKNEFSFINFLSFLSAYKIQNPCLILVHADKMPKGNLWNYFLQITSKVIHVQRKQPKKVFGKKIPFVEHRAAITKLEALKEYGGIYLDTDQVILKPLDRFRIYDTTVGLNYESSVASSIVISRKNAAFIKLWYESYRSYARTEGNKHANMVPFRLAQKHRELVNIAEGLLTTANAHQISLIFTKNMDWSKQYGIHLHAKLRERFYSDKFDINTIKSMNTTAGAVARYIIYGNTDLCMARTIIH